MDDIDTTPRHDDFDAFVTAHAAALVRLARRVLRDPGHAEDVVQDVLAKAYQRWDRIVGLEAPEAYVRRMVLNACTSFWRRPTNRELTLEAGTMSVAVDRRHRSPDATGAVDDRDLVVAALRTLPRRQRAVLVLRHYEGLPDAEIAALLGITPQTVRSTAHRGLAALRTRVDAALRPAAQRPVATVPARREVPPCPRLALAG